MRLSIVSKAPDANLLNTSRWQCNTSATFTVPCIQYHYLQYVGIRRMLVFDRSGVGKCCWKASQNLMRNLMRNIYCTKEFTFRSENPVF